MKELDMNEQPDQKEQQAQTANQSLGEERKQQIRKSQVRVVVTYSMMGAYVFTSIVLVGWLMVLNKPEMAIGVFSGVASTSASIIAFWFGSRGPASQQSGAGQPQEVQQ
jgi:hypothetical protein